MSREAFLIALLELELITTLWHAFVSCLLYSLYLQTLSCLRLLRKTRKNIDLLLTGPSTTFFRFSTRLFHFAKPISEERHLYDWLKLYRSCRWARRISSLDRHLLLSPQVCMFNLLHTHTQRTMFVHPSSFPDKIFRTPGAYYGSVPWTLHMSLAHHRALRFEARRTATQLYATWRRQHIFISILGDELHYEYRLLTLCTFRFFHSLDFVHSHAHTRVGCNTSGCQSCPCSLAAFDVRLFNTSRSTFEQLWDFRLARLQFLRYFSGSCWDLSQYEFRPGSNNHRHEQSNATVSSATTKFTKLFNKRLFRYERTTSVPKL